MNKISCLLLLAAAVFVAAEKQRTVLPEWHQLDGYTFQHFIEDHDKVYSAEEFANRRELFERRLQDVKAHNGNPNFSWKKGINHLSDWTLDEMKNLKGYDKNLGAALRKKRASNILVNNVDEAIALPRHVDWRNRGVVTPVKDQGRCGSCWTFAAAETLESHYAISTGRLNELSQQHIIDCVPNPQDCGGQGGCTGGTVELAYQTLMDNNTAAGGLATEWTYPYRSYYADNFTCSYNRTRNPVAARVLGYKALPTNQLKPLMNAVATLGPIAISVDASAWSSYESGVFDGCNQTNPDIDHAVQLVGYGTDNTLGNYWLVRNSWGPRWGEKGYIRIKRTDNEESRCGTDITPQDGDECAGGPPTQTVCGTCGILFDSAYPLV